MFTPEEISEQLRKPQGEKGLVFAESMNKLSASLIRMNYREISKYPGNIILEIGFGSGAFLKELILLGHKKVLGIDYSQTMKKEAEKINTENIKKKKIELYLADAESMPLEESSVDKIITINTIYFWDNPEKVLKEIQRVLKPGGLLGVGFRTDEGIRNLEFTNYNFRRYSIKMVKELLEAYRFEVISVKKDKDMEYDAVSLIARNNN